MEEVSSETSVNTDSFQSACLRHELCKMLIGIMSDTDSYGQSVWEMLGYANLNPSFSLFSLFNPSLSQNLKTGIYLVNLQEGYVVFSKLVLTQDFPSLPFFCSTMHSNSVPQNRLWDMLL